MLRRATPSQTKPDKENNGGAVRAHLPREAGVLGAHWRAKVGAASDLVVHRTLHAMLDAHGVDAVIKAIDVYASADEGPGPGKSRKLSWFAEEFQRWHAIAETPLVADGVLTPRGERIMRAES